jgi:hypothetical protein
VDAPGVSVEMIRHVLKQVREKGLVECLARARNDLWKKTSG